MDKGARGGHPEREISSTKDASMNTSLTKSRYAVITLVVILVPVLGLLLAGCNPEPLAKKKVKRRPTSSEVVSTALAYAAAKSEPELLRDDLVKPAGYL